MTGTHVEMRDCDGRGDGWRTRYDAWHSIDTTRNIYMGLVFLHSVASAPSCHLRSHTFLLEADAKKHANARHR